MIVGFIGLGTMGAPMARNILAKGHRLIVADVQPAAVAALIAAGATAAATPRDVAEASGIVITMLSAMIPARRAGKLAPIVAMKGDYARDTKLSRMWIVGAVLLGAF